MNRYRASFAERRRAAASITWPDGTLILANPDPGAQRKLKGVAVAMVTAACLFSITGTNGPLLSWARSRDYLDMRPAMESAFKGGNRSAGTWLAVHFNRDYPGLLQAESKAGEPTAMYLVARTRLQKHVDLGGPMAVADADREIGMRLMRQAAAAGSQDALRYLISVSTN
ncbi:MULTISPECIES: hypothetical protein [unclassified Burkholderia]|uniref:hypothetical protein n=1 Tax=unclassified Burkholderia TaxID=2613784 RepID=UPI0010F55205|nr:MULTISPECIES: hypothetical protein [unclassified Burkholderia]